MIPLLRIKLIVLLHLVMHGFSITVSNILVDGLDLIGSWKEFFQIPQGILTLLLFVLTVHLCNLKILKNNINI